MYNYGNILILGDGIPVNEEESFKYFKLAAEKGDKDTMACLSFMYDKGIGTVINKKQSQRYYQMAIKNCSISVFNTIGSLHCFYPPHDFEK